MEVETLAGALALGVWTRPGAAGLLPALLGERRAVLLADEAIAARIDGPFAARVTVAGGEPAKDPASLERLWRALSGAELERRAAVVAAGGGTVTDAAGFAAATFRRGLAWIALPSTLVGQVDAAIGGKTGINVAAKNDVGAFHLPEATLCDPELLATLPARERRAGMAEVVKTALLAGGPLYDLVAAGAGQDAAARAPQRRLQGARRGRRPDRAGSPGDPQPRPHDRPRRRGRGLLGGSRTASRWPSA